MKAKLFIGLTLFFSAMLLLTIKIGKQVKNGQAKLVRIDTNFIYCYDLKKDSAPELIAYPKKDFHIQKNEDVIVMDSAPSNEDTYEWSRTHHPLFNKWLHMIHSRTTSKIDTISSPPKIMHRRMVNHLLQYIHKKFSPKISYKLEIHNFPSKIKGKWSKYDVNVWCGKRLVGCLQYDEHSALDSLITNDNP